MFAAIHFCVLPFAEEGAQNKEDLLLDKKVCRGRKKLLTVGGGSAMMWHRISRFGDCTMKNLFASYFYSYFYFFGFGADKVKVLFAANNGSDACA